MNTPREDILSSNAPASVETSAIIAKGLVENLPIILDSLREVYAMRAKESAFKAALEARCADMRINSQNFTTLVQGLTELSKAESADEDTKAMYRQMIKDLFDLFTSRSNSSDMFSKFMNG